MRLRMAWNILRGRPVAYRVRIRDGSLDLRGMRGAIVQEVTIIGADTAILTDAGVFPLISYGPAGPVSPSPGA